MAHYSVLLVLLLVLRSSSASHEQFFEEPGTAIIEAVPDDDSITSDERGDQDFVEDSPGICQASESFVGSPAVQNQHSSEFESFNYNPPEPDPYLRATFLNGHFYPYSAYNAYENMYQVELNDPERGRGLNHNHVWYPYTNPNVYPSVPYSNIPPVSSLPPVYASLYGKSWPFEQDWFPRQVRRQRRRHDDDDLLKQLEYESIMKNILPTMSIPLPRDATPQSARTPYSYATFLHGNSDCALPILLGCTPKITYGKMENSNLAPVPYAYAYRNLPETNKVHDHIDINAEKVVNNH